MERGLFDRDEEVKARLRRMVLCRLYIYGGGHPTAPRWAKLLQERFGTTAIPYYVVVTPEDAVVGRTGFPGGSMEPLKRILIDLMDRALADRSR